MKYHSTPVVYNDITMKTVTLSYNIKPSSLIFCRSKFPLPTSTSSVYHGSTFEFGEGQNRKLVIFVRRE